MMSPRRKTPSEGDRPTVDSRLLTVDEAGLRLDVWLARQCAPISRSRLQTLIEEGLVTVDGQAAAARDRTRVGQQIQITVPPPAAAEPQPEKLALDLVYEDQDLMVVNKPAGIVVHPAPGHASGTLVNGLIYHYCKLEGVGGSIERPGIVHRLDKDTSGLLVVAKNESAYAALVAQFQQNRVAKYYLALVHGQPRRPVGSIETTIGRHPVDRKRMAANPPHGKLALSHYETVETNGQVTLLRVRIETGRTHQIRVHLAHIGVPIVGDPVYGRRYRDNQLASTPSRQLLHATELAFDHPADGRRLSFRAPPPADMANFLILLRGDAHEKRSASAPDKDHPELPRRHRRGGSKRGGS